MSMTPEELADRQPDDGFKPSRTLSADTKRKLANVTDARKSAAAAPAFELERNDGWRKQQGLWASADDDCKRDWLYHLVLWCGVTVRLKAAKQRIARFFGIKPADLDPFMDIMWMADEARCLKIDSSTFARFLLSDTGDNGAFNIQQQFAYHVRDPAYEDVDSQGDRPVKIEFTSAAVDKNDPERVRMEEALAKRIASVTQLKIVPKNAE